MVAVTPAGACEVFGPVRGPISASPSVSDSPQGPISSRFSMLERLESGDEMERRSGVLRFQIPAVACAVRRLPHCACYAWRLCLLPYPRKRQSPQHECGLLLLVLSDSERARCGHYRSAPRAVAGAGGVGTIASRQSRRLASLSPRVEAPPIRRRRHSSAPPLGQAFGAPSTRKRRRARAAFRLVGDTDRVSASDSRGRQWELESAERRALGRSSYRRAVAARA